VKQRSGLAMTRRRWAAAAAVWVGLLAVFAVVAATTVSPARANLPQTLYVDAAFGHDAATGATPEAAVRTLDAALLHVRPGGSILLTGYGINTVYQRADSPCVTVRGQAGRPITITRNVYTNRLRQPVLTTRTKLVGRFSAAGDPRTWTVPWPHDPRMVGGHGYGFVTVGVVALDGWDRPPPASVPRAAWWRDGTLYLRLPAGTDPNKYPVVIDDGPALCLTGESAHVVIAQLNVVGAVRSVEIQPGAVDVSLVNVYARSVVREALIAPSAASAGSVEGSVTGP
jgi:hypothetical protein